MINEGLGWITAGLMPHTLDNLIGESVQPLIVAFVDKAKGSWWAELGGDKTSEYSRMLVEELVPHLDATYRTEDEPQARAIMGTLASARAAAHTALEHPQVFGKLALRSISLEGPASEELFDMLGQANNRDLEMYFDWNRYEWRSEENGYDRREDSLRLAQALEQSGRVYVGGEWSDSYGWGSLRSHNDAMLRALFPLR